MLAFLQGTRQACHFDERSKEKSEGLLATLEVTYEGAVLEVTRAEAHVTAICLAVFLHRSSVSFSLRREARAEGPRYGNLLSGVSPP